MTYRQISTSVAIAGLQLVLIVALVWVTQSGGPKGPITEDRAAAAPVPAPTPLPSATPTPAPVVAVAPPTRPSGNLALTVVSWGGEYQASQHTAFFQPFVADTGKALNEVSYEGVLDASAISDNLGNWDVISLEHSDLLSGCQQGILEPIDWARVGKTADFIPAAVERCGVGSIVWAYVLAFNPQTVARTPVSWADLWSTESIPGKRALRKSAKFNLEVALMADGVPTRDVYAVLATPAGVDRAFAKLEEIKNDLLFWDGGQQPFDMIAANQIVMTAAYNGRVTKARKAGLPVETVWTNIIYTVDFWVLARGSANLDIAYDFLAYVSQPQPGAQLAERIPYGPANLNAIALLDEQVTAELPTAPGHLRFGLLSNAEFWNARPDLEKRFADWAR